MNLNVGYAMEFYSLQLNVTLVSLVSAVFALIIGNKTHSNVLINVHHIKTLNRNHIK